jgi:hypothetical protein
MAALPQKSKGLLISQLKPTIAFGGEVAPLTADWLPRGEWNKVEYSRFMIQGLADYIDTEFCITVQWDGYGVNKRRWNDEFLNYDYIGAPWPTSMNLARVGNGGFSLRSKRWLETASMPRTSPPFNGEPEDDWSCNKFRAFYQSKGCKIAPIHAAVTFSIEWPLEEYPWWSIKDCFGFHGFFTPGTELYRLPKS